MTNRRPFPLIMGLFFTGICIEYTMQNNIWNLLLIGAVVMAAFLISNNGKNTLLFICIILVLAGCFWMNLRSLDGGQIKKLQGEVCSVTGMAVAVKEKREDVYQIILKTESITYGGTTYPFKEKILCNVAGKPENPQDFTGRAMRIDGTMSAATKARNPNTFDYALYLKSVGIHGILISKNLPLEVSNHCQNVILNKMALFRVFFMKSLLRSYEEGEAGLFQGILFGDKTYIQEDVYEDFQKNGTAHILAVSGLHIGIIYGCLNGLFRNRKNGSYRILIGVALVFYAALSGFSVSVNRAVAMIALHMLGDTFHKRYDLISSACFVAVVFAIINPYTIFNAGFLLSFLAVFTIGTVHSILERKIPMKGWTLKNILPCFSIQIGMAPITAYQFHCFSFSAFFVNVPVILISGLLLPMGLILMVLTCFAGFGSFFCILFDALASASKMLLLWMMKINEVSAINGIGYLYVTSPAKSLLVAYYGALLLFCSESLPYYWKKQYVKKITRVFILLLIVCMVGTVMEEQSRPEITFVDVGQGDCIHIRTPGGKNILIDSGGSLDLDYDLGKKMLLPYLLGNGVRKIDYALVTHMDADHMKGFESLSKEIKITNWAFSKDYESQKQEILQRFGIYRENINFLSKGDQIIFEKNIIMDIALPFSRQKEGKTENSKSLAGMFSYEDLKIFLTGDIGIEEELQIKESVKSDIIKVPHHGSKHSSSQEIIEKASPKVAVIQVGKNNFGHPQKGIIERYLKSGIIVFRTDLHGAVCIQKGKHKKKIFSMLGKEKYEF